ncbi:hypothetical protein GCM10009540_46200 [Streptomyces turgidiscabies]
MGTADMGGMGLLLRCGQHTGNDVNVFHARTGTPGGSMPPREASWRGPHFPELIQKRKSQVNKVGT